MGAVARAARVSPSTVSRTINCVSTVNAKMAKRVWDAIRELSYMPNTQARALGSGRSRLFGLIVPEIANRFFLELVLGFEDVAVEYGYEILIGSANNNAERVQFCFRRMIERGVEGVAVMTFGSEEPLIGQLANRRVPLVFAGTAPEQSDISSVHVDYDQGIRQGVRHLVALGHRDIGFIAGPLRSHTARSRVMAFRRSLAECGISVDEKRMIEADHTTAGGVAAAKRFCEQQDLPTAIMCSNDMLAIGVLCQMSRAGVRVPADLSLIGFDDIHMAELTIPPLTSIQISGPELAHAAVVALRAHVECLSPGARYEIATRLVVRESTGVPRSSMAHSCKKRIY